MRGGDDNPDDGSPRDFSHPTSLAAHERRGKLLVPPLFRISDWMFVSWLNDRLPEMLWAVLLVASLSRDEALRNFRSIASGFFSVREGNRPPDLTISAFAALDPETFQGVMKNVLADDAARRALEPICCLTRLPGRRQWMSALGCGATSSSWDAVREAVGAAFDHQSQEATDCRWVTLLYQVLLRRLAFTRSTAELGKAIWQYPSYGDMAQVSPAIRAAEMSQRDGGNSDRTWPQDFWEECMSATPCEPWHDSNQLTPQIDVLNLASRCAECHTRLVEHCNRSRTTTGLDPKHDAVFGIAMYALKIFSQLIKADNDVSALGRLGLRTLFECWGTLAFLQSKDDPSEWTSYREYGQGQAKLACLKLEGDPGALARADADRLRTVAEADRSLEFTAVNLGHWAGSDMRKMSEELGMKADYDRVYPWTSGYVHGHWGAVRDTVFCTCANPLHRFHSIPGDPPLRSIVADVCMVVDRILDQVNAAIPPFDCRIGRSEG